MVGMHLIAALLKRGEGVRALRRADASMHAVEAYLRYTGADTARLEWVEGDILDVPSLEAGMQGCASVFHAAAMVSFHKADRKRMYDVNINGTANLVNTALAFEVERFIYISSVAALGRQSTGKAVHEDSEWKDGPELTHYARTKHMAEREVWRGREEGLQVIVVNPSVILGIGDFDRSSAEIFKQVAKGLPFYPGGVNGFVGVQDVVAACFHLMEGGHYNQRYLLSAEHKSFKILFEDIAKAMGVKAPRRKAGKALLQVGRVAAWLIERASGRKAFITRESVRNSGRHHQYDTRRIEESGFRFTPLQGVIDETASYFLAMKEAQ